ncbi:MAG: sensor histidine kinase, partial [Polyangiales bacterium]
MRLRFGLRAQIVVALSAVFVVSFALLGTATLRLTQAASAVERASSAAAYARALAVALGRVEGSDRASLEATLDLLLRRGGLRAARLQLRDGSVLVAGAALSEPGVAAPLPEGGTLTLWLPPPTARANRALGNLLLFYVSMTGLAVLVLAYLSLTSWIVRPLDQLTRGSELLAAGSTDVRVPERGAAEVARLAAAFNDMARQLRAQRQALEQRLRELEHKTTELKNTQQQLIHGEKLASVGRLAAGVAHEIGNPLAAILGLTELLRAGDVAPEQAAEFLARIHGETERIHRIIRDLLDFSRRDPEDVAGQSADLAQAVADAVNLVRPQKESQQIEIAPALAPGLPRVQGPQHRLTQVLLNLLLNAVDALGGRGRIEISAERADGECLLCVSDDGPGLSDEVLARLFEPFTTTKPPGKGTGLGLAVCHALVEGMGGTIRAENRPEGGARFEVRLRIAQS